MRQIEGWLGLHWRLRRRTAAAVATQVAAHLFGLVDLDRTGVRWWFLFARSDAYRRQSIQNEAALDFQLSCKIVDSNFAHPSLFISSALSCSYQPHRSRNLFQLYYP
jgi:hypothetical protein